MSERCAQPEVNHIAADLNAGNRTEAVHGLNICTMDLINNSDYAKTMHEMGDKVMKGEPDASAKAESDFATLAKQEGALWKSIKETANAANPAGLCQLSIEDGKSGPSVNITGDKCN